MYSFFHTRKVNWIHFYFFILIIISLFIRLYLSQNTRGFFGDQWYFINWMNLVDKYGLGNIYKDGSLINYPPLFIVLLGLYKELLNVIHLQAVPGNFLIKIPSILFDMFAIFIFIQASRKVENPFLRALFVTIFAFNPAVLFESSIWGQIDMLHSILMVCSILLLVHTPFYSGIYYSLALLTKFQSIIIAPIFAIFFLMHIWQKKESKMLFRYTLGFLIPLVLAGSFFAAHGTYLLMFKKVYLSAIGAYPKVTLSAMNIWYYAIGTTPNMLDTLLIFPHITLKRAGLLLLFIAVILTCIYLIFNQNNKIEVLLKSATFLSFSFFMLPTEIHERYCFPALICGVFVVIFDKKWIGIILGLTTTIFLNLLMVYTINTHYLEKGSNQNYLGINPNTGMFVVILNCLLFYSMVKLLMSDLNGSPTAIFAKLDNSE